MFERVQAEFSSKALLRNYDSIRAQVPGQSLLPMIKANAYGHGAAWAARVLSAEPALHGFGVATLEEGAEVRKALGAQRKRVKILVVSGAAVWSDEKGHFCEKHGLTPAISNEEDWVKFLRGGWAQRIPYEIKFNTGMNRLGIAPNYARVIARALRNRPSEEHPDGIFSHLAIGENPEEKLSRMQRELFVQIRGELEGALPSARFHLANSAAIWNAKRWGLEGLTEIVRPGLSLYGVVPFSGAPARGLEPVLELRSKVVARRTLKAGERVGYGGTFKAKENTEVATFSSGYADGVKRSFSNSGSVFFGEQEHSIIGIVSMDLFSATCPKAAKIGDWARILGKGIDIWKQASAAGTIPYEFLTSVANRVERIYS